MGQRLAQLVYAVVAVLALLFPVSAHAACNSERGAFLEEWKAHRRYDLLFDEYHGVLVQTLTSGSYWSNPQELAKMLAEQPPADIPPAEVAFVQCLVRERLTELGGKPAAPTRQQGMSSFASGSRDDDAESTAAAPSRQANCELKMGEVNSGALSTDSVTMTNTCTSKVVFVYCITSANGGGSFSCDRSKFGTNSIGASGTGYLSISGASLPFDAHWFACVADEANQNPFPSRPRWDGANIHAVCT